LCSEAEAVSEQDEASSEQAEEMKNKVDECIRGLLDREPVLSALREVAPDLYVSRDTGGLRNLGLTQLKGIREILERQKNVDKMVCAWRPGLLIRAVADLYKAPSLEEATETLGITTADEEAMRRLAQLTEEFAPALAELRGKAIDCELFTKFKEEMIVKQEEEEDDKDDISVFHDDEVEDLEALEENGPKPVALPEGWKLEWVSQIRGKTSEQYRFVDPVGRKYYSVAELRVAISGGHAAVEELRRSRQEARALENLESTAKNRGRPAVTRKRSRW
jgi:hypothetical protein